MKKSVKISLLLLAIVLTTDLLHAQRMKVGELLIVSNSGLRKGIKPESFVNWVNEDLAPLWNKNYPGTGIHLFHADRGHRKGEYLLVASAARLAYREALPEGSPFTETVNPVANTESKTLADFLKKPNAYTEYQLIGAENFKSLPVVSILGIHYIKVKPGRSADFEKFVVDKLHPAVGKLFPDMQLLYYKAVAGENQGDYITIFTIASEAARDKYWPAGAPETETLKKGFLPLKELAVKLGDYLVEGSYLKPESGGAAAYFESVTWTDFVYSK